MKKKYFLYGKFIALFILLDFACNKQPINQMAPGYFPNAVGDTWTYDVTDSAEYSGGSNNTVRHYTVKVSIVGSIKLADGKEATLWQYNYPFGNDTNYVRIVGDTIKIFDNGYNSKTIEGLKYPKLIFVQPFKVNESWNGGHLGLDTLSVLKQEDVNSSFQTFKNCYNIYYQYGAPNIELKDNYWFKPQVGFVRVYKDDFYSAPIQYHKWELRTYYIH